MIRKQFSLVALLGLFLVSCSPSAVTPTSQVDLSSPTAPAQTPTEPATATQTFTPPPTFTSTPYPMYFTEDFNADLNSWEFFQTGGSTIPKAMTENSQLRIDFTSSDTWYYAIQNAHEYSSVAISAKVDGNPSGSIGLVCDYNESKGWYEFSVASDGTYSVLYGQWLAQDIAQYTPIATDTTNHLAAGSLNHTIGMTCQGDTLFLYINGRLFRTLDVSRYGLAQGKIGITASSFDEIPMSAFVDWVSVSEK
ncbi:MAG: hypothetical protein HZB50_00795 [Chloroflexi bacterium]|nr:hypothetical protein [Chloroflexota bacterium]